ncbi:MAG TPA: cyclodeaminase/cyclohydrolase family protein, partial [Phycisphaerales bacterium]|nr:cyclodeaminase/cyclohydrolase family protein [Phycisphaerales bacterium]
MSALGGQTFEDLLTSLAAKTPTPGGGAVAGATGALGCALAGMVVSYSVGKKDLAPHRERLESAGAELERWRAEFLRLGDADAEAYGRLNALQKLPPTPGDPARAAEMAAAVEGALGVPVRCLRLSVELVKRCLELAPISNRYLRSDLA